MTKTRFYALVQRSVGGFAGVVMMTAATAAVPLLLVNDAPLFALLAFLAGFVGLWLVARARSAAMTASEVAAVCGRCNTHFRAIPTTTLLGFRRMRCPACRTPITRELTSGYRIAYSVLLGVMMLSAVLTLSDGRSPVLSWFGIVSILVLVLVLDARHGRTARRAATGQGRTMAP